MLDPFGIDNGLIDAQHQPEFLPPGGQFPNRLDRRVPRVLAPADLVVLFLDPVEGHQQLQRQTAIALLDELDDSLRLEPVGRDVQHEWPQMSPREFGDFGHVAADERFAAVRRTASIGGSWR